MEKIDLTKCNNCRFRAVVDGNKVAGRIEKSKLGFIVKGGEWFGCVISLGELDSLMRGERILLNNGNFYVVDFEIVPRDPETYQDWQVGDIIWDSHGSGANGSGANGRIIFRSGEFVAADIDGMCICYTCKEMFNDGYRLILTDIEQQIIEEKKEKKYEPQDGDVCYAENRDGYCTPFIYRHTGLNRTAFYAAFDKWGNVLMYHGNAISKETLKMLRPATDEEKQRLFDAMAKEGKRWNAEKKCVENIPKPYEFRKGEPVLVRDDIDMIWRLMAFIEIEKGVYYQYWAGDGHCRNKYRHCIPYNERTMHLLGTTEDYKEE